MKRVVHLKMRRPPWIVRTIRHWRNPDGCWPVMDAKPWWWYWFAALVPYRFRRPHHWYATAFGYFWLPCPLCGDEFGGHEWRTVRGLHSSIPGDRPGSGRGICPRCTGAGRGRMRDDWPPPS